MSEPNEIEILCEHIKKLEQRIAELEMEITRKQSGWENEMNEPIEEIRNTLFRSMGILSEELQRLHGLITEEDPELRKWAMVRIEVLQVVLFNMPVWVEDKDEKAL